MPIISVTTADILKSKTLDAGWYGADITAVAGPKTSAAGDSVNFVVSFTLDDKSPAPGKSLDNYFNSKAIGMIVPLISAVRNQPVEAKDFQLDTDELMHKKVDVKIVVATYEGSLRNNIAEFAPYGVGTSQKAPF